MVTGKIVRLTKFGAFVDIGAEKDGLIHISELAHTRVEDPSEVVQVGEEVQIKVLAVDQEKGQVSLSLKAATPEPVMRFQSAREDRPVLTLWRQPEGSLLRRMADDATVRPSASRQRERGMPKGEERTTCSCAPPLPEIGITHTD